MTFPEEPQSLQSRLLEHLQAVSCARDPIFSPLGHLAVRSYIRERLGQWGQVEAEPFTAPGQEGCNLILELPGQPRPGNPLAPILIGAHYDAVHGSPGADDNATGVAALLEIARTFARQPARRPLRLVAFDLEERGCLGSQVHAWVCIETEQPLGLMISLEMLGYCQPTPQSQRYPLAWMSKVYPQRGNFMALVGNLGALPALWQLRRALRHSKVPTALLPIVNQGHPIPRVRASDHAAFWDAGYNAVMVTDTAELRNPHYHQDSDRIETLDLPFLARVTQGLTLAIQRF